MRIDWQPHSTEAVALELLQAAADLVDSKGRVPIAVTLARAGAQVFSDRVLASGQRSALKMIASLTEETFGRHRGWKWLKAIVLDRSSAIKHASLNDPSTVMLSYELATMLVFCGILDFGKATGKSPPPILAQFMNRHATAIQARLSSEYSATFLTTMMAKSQAMGQAWRPPSSHG